MARVKILSTPGGRPGVPDEIGDVEDSGLSFSQRRGQFGRGRLESPGCHELIDLLGDGYMMRPFHLVQGKRLLSNCRIVRMSGHIEFEYEREVTER